MEDPATIEDGAAVLNAIEASVKTILKNQAAIAKHLADATTFTDAFGKPFTGIDSGEA